MSEEPGTGASWLRSVFENRMTCGLRRALQLVQTVTGSRINRASRSPAGGGGAHHSEQPGRHTSVCLLWCQVQTGEFDPGSERTLAACLRHASRAERLLREYSSGARVSNTWAIYLRVWDNPGKLGLIPDETTASSGAAVKDGLSLEAIARRWARVPLASWRGNGPPRRRWVAGLRG